MKQFINEAKRMQVLAGILNESQLNENEDWPKKLSSKNPGDYLFTLHPDGKGWYRMKNLSTGKYDQIRKFDTPEDAINYTKNYVSKDEEKDWELPVNNKLEPIKDDLSNLKPEYNVETNYGGLVGIYKGVLPTTGKHKVVFDIDGDSRTYSKDELIKTFKVYKK